MKTVKDLGLMVKSKYPQYRDMSDEDLGRLIKQKYPGSYDDFVDIITTEVQKLDSLYSSDRGRVTSWWQRGKSEARAKLYTAVNAETLLLIQALTVRWQLTHLGERLALLEELERAKLINQIIELQAASQEGLGVETYRQIRVLQAAAAIENEKERGRMQIAVDKYQQEKLIDFRIEELLAALDAKMADLKNLMPYHELDVLHSQLSEINREYLQLETLSEDEYKRREMERLMSKLQTWEGDIRGRQTRLLQRAEADEEDS